MCVKEQASRCPVRTYFFPLFMYKKAVDGFKEKIKSRTMNKSKTIHKSSRRVPESSNSYRGCSMFRIPIEWVILKTNKICILVPNCTTVPCEHHVYRSVLAPFSESTNPDTEQS